MECKPKSDSILLKLEDVEARLRVDRRLLRLGPTGNVEVGLNFRRMSKPRPSLFALIDFSDTCWTWKGGRFSRVPYGRLKIQGKTMKAHRVVYEICVGPIPKGLLGCHTCDNPPCVNPNHIFLGTNKDNQQDAKLKGRKWTPGGEDHYLAKLTDQTVIEARQRYDQDHSQLRPLAREFGVSVITMWHCMKRHTWKHLP